MSEPPAGPPAPRDPEPPAGPVVTAVWPLAWPSMISFGLNSMVSLIDFVIVGQLGGIAIAGAGVALQVHFALFAVFAAVNTGTTALVARAMGRGDRVEADRVLRLSVLLSIGIGAASMLTIPLAPSIVSAFQVEADVVDAGARYLAMLFSANVALGVRLVMESALRGAGDVRTPLFVGLLVNVVNVVLNYGFVFGRLGLPELGLVGSALGTALALVAGLFAYLWLWWRNLLVIPRGAFFDGVDGPRCRRILDVGIPTAIEQTAFQIGLILFLRLVAAYGTEPISAYVIGVRVLSLSFVPGLGFMTASSTLVGQYLGARQPEMARRFGWRATASAIATMASIGLAIILAARPLAALFGATGPETVDLTVWFIRILGAAQPLMAIEFALGGALRGAGDTRFPLFAILTGLFVFRLGGAWSLHLGWQASIVAVWSCLLADYAVKAGMLALRFASDRWEHARVEPD